jgi:GMP synthase-like glutamine amidotransferase
LHIGILQTDSVKPELALRHGDYPDMFRSLLADPEVLPAGCPVPTFLDIDACQRDFPDARACDAYVITGSRHSVYDDLPWIAPLADFVADALGQQRRVVGICFGHQLIAHHFGGEARAADAGWCVGVQRARVVDQAGWMDPPADAFKLPVSHRDQVVRLPPGARVFAVGEQCPLAGFVLGDALAFQGHPEFSHGYAGELMDSRRQALGEVLLHAGKASLSQDSDARLVARWMLNFMRRSQG